MTAITCATILDVHKKHNFIVCAHTSTQCVSPAQPVELILPNPTLLMRVSAGDAGQSVLQSTILSVSMCVCFN